MFNNYLKIAFRNLIKNKLLSAINITGLGVSLATCIFILIWIMNETSFDKFHQNLSRIYRVNLRDVTYEQHRNYESTPPPLAKEMLNDFPGIDFAVPFETVHVPVKHNESSLNAITGFSSEGFFDIFSFQLNTGSRNDLFKNPYSLMITEQMAEKLFAQEEAVGKTILLYNEFVFTVAGIIKDLPDQSSIQFDILISIAHLEELTGNGKMNSWNEWGYETFILLNEKTEQSVFDEKIADYVLSKAEFSWKPQLYLQPFNEIHLHNVNGGGQIVYVIIFSIIALFVLIIACINFINLTTAQSTLRLREIGLRKIVGASKKNLVIQLLIESFILVFCSMLVSVSIVELIYPFFIEFTGQQIAKLELFTSGIILDLLLICITVGLISGLYPALYLSSVKPVKAFKQMPNSSSSILRKILIIFQFSISIFLIISSIVVYKQVRFLNKQQLGFDSEHVLYIPLNKEIRESFDSFHNELLSNPQIKHSTLTSGKIGMRSMGSLDLRDWEGNDGAQQILVNIISTQHGFLETFGLNMAEGNFFSRQMTSEEVGIIFNETAIRAMGIENPVGTKSLDDYPIIGVIEDFNFESLRSPIKPLIILSVPNWYSHIAVKLNGEDLAGTIEFIEQKFLDFAHDSQFEYQFADDAFDQLYRSEQRMGTMFGVFSIVAIVLSRLGLFALSLFMVQRRLKEIGIRKVLGSSVNSIFILLSTSFIKWVFIAFLISAPIAYYMLSRWLTDYAYRISLDAWIFILSGGIALSISLVTVGLQTYQGANSNPVDILKNE